MTQKNQLDRKRLPPFYHFFIGGKNPLFVEQQNFFLPKTLQVSNRRLSINLLIKKLLGMSMEGKKGGTT